MNSPSISPCCWEFRDCIWAAVTCVGGPSIHSWRAAPEAPPHTRNSLCVKCSDSFPGSSPHLLTPFLLWPSGYYVGPSSLRFLWTRFNALLISWWQFIILKKIRPFPLFLPFFIISGNPSSPPWDHILSWGQLEAHFLKSKFPFCSWPNWAKW